MFWREIKSAILVFILLTVITGLFYPLSITAIAQRFFPKQANGSLIYQGGKIIGSTLIGQQFDDPKYFWGRLSATSVVSYNAASSSGSNIGPSNPALIDKVKARIKALKEADQENSAPIPVDLVTSSASGLDPHISLLAAYYQIPRIAKKRNISESILKALIAKNTQGRFFGLLGEPVVNVLKLNLDLDSYKK